MSHLLIILHITELNLCDITKPAKTCPNLFEPATNKFQSILQLNSTCVIVISGANETCHIKNNTLPFKKLPIQIGKNYLKITENIIIKCRGNTFTYNSNKTKYIERFKILNETFAILDPVSDLHTKINNIIFNLNITKNKNLTETQNITIQDPQTDFPIEYLIAIPILMVLGIVLNILHCLYKRYKKYKKNNTQNLQIDRNEADSNETRHENTNQNENATHSNPTTNSYVSYNLQGEEDIIM